MTVYVSRMTSRQVRYNQQIKYLIPLITRSVRPLFCTGSVDILTDSSLFQRSSRYSITTRPQEFVKPSISDDSRVSFLPRFTTTPIFGDSEQHTTDRPQLGRPVFISNRVENRTNDSS